MRASGVRRKAIVPLLRALVITLPSLGLVVLPANAGPTLLTTGTEVPVVRTLPAVTLHSTDGPVAVTAFRGKWLWIYFGYTNCPDVCPFALADMAAAYRQLAHPEQVQVLFVSVDSERDTPTVSQTYAAYFHPAFRGATGAAEDIRSLLGAMGGTYRILPPANPAAGYAVSHPNVVYVVDPTGRVVGTNARPASLIAAFGAVGAAASDQDARPGGSTVDPAQVALVCEPPGAAMSGTDMGSDTSPGRPEQALMTRARTLGSGTAILPTATPMRMWTFPLGDWLGMLHGDLVLGYNAQGGPRGATAWAAENWEMAMASRALGPGVLDLKAMTSLEPLTLPAGGTPQLFQTGETYQLNPLIDRQHPHDLLMEVSGRYTWNLDTHKALFLYGGLAGEPALGPVAYLHRPSSADNHGVPLGHHLQDSTHVAFGVATVGARFDALQVEASLFNGREPDEFRYNLDLGPLDSWSGRVSLAPTPNWTMQASYGHLKNPELLHPGDVDRITASAMYVTQTPLGLWASHLVCGVNVERHADQLVPLMGLGLESQWDLFGANHVYGRLEWVDKDGLPPDPPLNHVIHRIGALTLGFVRDLGISQVVDLGLGGEVTAIAPDAIEAQLYGPLPISGRVYLRLRPPVHGHLPGQGIGRVWGSPK